MTVIEMVKDIMSDMDSDEVDSITDTDESAQVEKILKQVYFQLCANQLIPEHSELSRLSTVALGTYAGALNYLQIPETFQKVMWIKYNIIKDGDDDDTYADLSYLPPKSFMDLVLTNRSSDTDCSVVTDPTSGATYYVRTDTAPTHWTSFDDTFIALDSLDMVVDTAQVLGTKSLVEATLVPVWTSEDDFTPAIDDNLFPFLVAEAKSTAFMNLKNTANAKIEKQSRDQKIAIQGRKFKTDASQKNSTYSTSGINYGRRSPR
jgi:hypothetical protein